MALSYAAKRDRSEGWHKRGAGADGKRLPGTVISGPACSQQEYCLPNLSTRGCEAATGTPALLDIRHIRNSYGLDERARPPSRTAHFRSRIENDARQLPGN